MLENQEILDAMAVEHFGVSVTDAIAKEICIQCKELVKGERLQTEEYIRSGFCQTCWDKANKEMEQHNDRSE